MAKEIVISDAQHHVTKQGKREEVRLESFYNPDGIWRCMFCREHAPAEFLLMQYEADEHGHFNHYICLKCVVLAVGKAFFQNTIKVKGLYEVN